MVCGVSLRADRTHRYRNPPVPGPVGPESQNIHRRYESSQRCRVRQQHRCSGIRKCTSAAASNCNYWVKDTGIKYAFANSLFNAAIDLDKGDGGSESNYSDDVVYITYTKASLDASASPGPYPIAWDKGGVLRLITNNDPDPYNWFTSKLIDDIGPVTRSVDILQDKNHKKLWVFFGEARYFFRQDDLNTQRRIFGVADPCYSYDLDSLNQLSTTIDRCPSVNSGSDPVGNLTNQSGTPR